MSRAQLYQSRRTQDDVYVISIGYATSSQQSKGQRWFQFQVQVGWSRSVVFVLGQIWACWLVGGAVDELL